LRGWTDVRVPEAAREAALSARGPGAGRADGLRAPGRVPSQWKAIESISAKLSINHETLHQWVRRAETDAGERPGLTTDEWAKMKALERENKELRRANEILKAAATFFGAELDRQQH
jgi:transposase